MIKQINKILSLIGIQVKKSNALELQSLYYTNTILGLEELFAYRIKHHNTKINDNIAGLVFSKDRAMQLHALLVSYFERVQNPATLTVLYKTSNASFKLSYEQLKLELQSLPVVFIEEDNFYQQVKAWIINANAGRIFYMTDDAMLTGSFDMHDILHFNPLNEIFSLTKGRDLDFCFNHNRPQKLPDFQPVGNGSGAEPLFEWTWSGMEDSPDWNYPLSLDGTFFSREEMEILIRHTTFRNPNSMEANLQVFVKPFLNRKGVCYSHSKYVNIPCNLVQTEVKNRVTSAYSVEALNDLWQTGKRIDIIPSWKLDAPQAQEMKYIFK